MSGVLFVIDGVSHGPYQNSDVAVAEFTSIGVSVIWIGGNRYKFHFTRDGIDHDEVAEIIPYYGSPRSTSEFQVDSQADHPISI